MQYFKSGLSESGLLFVLHITVGLECTVNNEELFEGMMCCQFILRRNIHLLLLSTIEYFETAVKQDQDLSNDCLISSEENMLFQARSREFISFKGEKILVQSLLYSIKSFKEVYQVNGRILFHYRSREFKITVFSCCCLKIQYKINKSFYSLSFFCNAYIN